MELHGKRVVITGGTRGIGRALAGELRAAGCDVLVCGRSPLAAAEAQDALGVRAIACDVTTASGVARLAHAVRGELGGLDLLINNAGVQREVDLTATIDATAVADEVAINLLAPIAVTGALMPLLLSSPEAAVVNVTSALAIAPEPQAPVYSASKAALASLTHSLRAQLEGTAVRVVEVVPTLVATDMTAGRNDSAITPGDAAARIARGLRRGKRRILMGKARALAAIFRISPALARQVVRR